jgi:hypothetical protein
MTQPTKPATVPPRTLVNASIRETYKPATWHVRAGSEDHKKFLRRGF